MISSNIEIARRIENKSVRFINSSHGDIPRTSTYRHYIEYADSTLMSIADRMGKKDFFTLCRLLTIKEITRRGVRYFRFNNNIGENKDE